MLEIILVATLQVEKYNILQDPVNFHKSRAWLIAGGG